MAKRQYVYIFGEKHTKTSFGIKWTAFTRQNIGRRFSGADHQFLVEAVCFNPSWKKIIDRGGSFYFKPINKKFQGKKVRGIALITQNSSNEIWIGKSKLMSYIFPATAAVDVIKNNKKMALQALRQIIEPQMKAFRKAIRRQIKGRAGHKIRCAITNQTLDHGEFHIDHAYPFKNIVEDWCRDYRVDLEKLDVVCRGTKCTLRDTELAESFFDYHLMVAKLQPTTPRANLSKGARVS